eukprot:TRINITY_DN13051_c0_g1_i1.p1 TRINITY_DN13051_c0_g1~~TRINITY_DN13051_c0_g1_i1.p1  ORF type:complete len:406 (+),score=79.98 TRINITY_DN13051_c0_g1_i1:27-1244(+)
MTEEVLFNILQTRCYLVHLPSQTVTLVNDAPETLKCCKVSEQLCVKVGGAAISVTADSSCSKVSEGYYLFSGTHPDQMYLVGFASGIPKAFLDLFEKEISKVVKVQTPLPISLPVVILDGTPVFNLQYNPTPLVTATPDEGPHYIAQGIENASVTIATTIAAWSGTLKTRIEESGKSIIESSEAATTETEIPETLTRTIEVAKAVSPVMARVSTTIVGGLVSVATSTGGFVGEKIAERAEQTESLDPRYYTAKQIGTATLSSIGTVWEAVDEAAQELFEASVSTANSVLKHKYGNNVAGTVSDTCYIGRDIYTTVSSVKSLKPSKFSKQFAKTSATEAGRVVVKRRITKVEDGAVEEYTETEVYEIEEEEKETKSETNATEVDDEGSEESEAKETDGLLANQANM